MYFFNIGTWVYCVKSNWCTSMKENILLISIMEHECILFLVLVHDFIVYNFSYLY